MQRDGERFVTADERSPCHLVTVALALAHELQSFGRDGEDVALFSDRELAFERGIELGRHRCLASLITIVQCPVAGAKALFDRVTQGGTLLARTVAYGSAPKNRSVTKCYILRGILTWRVGPIEVSLKGEDL